MSDSAAGSDATAWWLDRRAGPLVAVGVLLVVSGIAHGVAWAVLGGPWEGPVTWRKPILFGISGGLTAVSLGWVWSKLPGRRGDVPLAWSTAIALLVEVGLIDLQRWRGVASHFNRQTPFDSAVYDTMGALILWVSLVSADLMIRVCGRRVAAGGPMRLAIRAGMVFLVVSCLLGIWVTSLGEERLAGGLEPERFGAAGVLKFPHGAVIHAIQWLPLLAWAVGRAGLGDRAGERLVGVATAGTGLMLCYAMVQTVAGRGRFDASPAVAAIGAVGIACLAVPAIVAVARWRAGRRRTA